MAVKVKLHSMFANPDGLGMRFIRLCLVVALAGMLLSAGIFGFYYHKYQLLVDQRINSGPIFANIAQIYAAPHEIRTGQKLTVGYIKQQLVQAGYNENPGLGTFDVIGDTITIKPGPQSYHSAGSATINTTGGEVQSISAENGATLRGYELEPLLITGLSQDKNRSKRLLVTYNEVPPQLVQAITAIEDRTFFENSGINYGRIIKCAITDLFTGKKQCGASTLTQQLAKNLFLSPDKTVKRKLVEILITFQLEARFTKQQIFAMYANEMSLGHRGSYEINGVGEAAQSFFGKNVQQLNLAECATLAAMFRNPSYYNPYRRPAAVVERRNLVLDSMVQTGAISTAQAEHAKAEPLGLAAPNIDAREAPYFIDLVHEQLVQRLGEQDLSRDSLRIYTSLDPELQAVASAAVEAGMPKVDDLIRKLHRKNAGSINYPQVSLIALDPHTGQVLALVGGRNYGISQLNHAQAQPRPTGSIFKPFVYATAYNTSLSGQSLGEDGVFTALTRLNDDPHDFVFDNGRQTYSPGNFEKGEEPGMVPAYLAIARSLNIATISLAEQVGYDNVAALARQSGISSARGTPSVAIGAYAATPLEMAGAYTVFANGGVHLTPWFLASVRNPQGDILADFTPEARQVLDPKVAYLAQSMLEGVVNYPFGTAAGIRRTFTAPAAGKTGTSHDVWFAGYTSNLLCIIWIGNDDYTDMSNGLTKKVQGADTAAPIWADFMSRAIKLPQYSDTKPFVAPDGVTRARIDRITNLLADSTCPNDIEVAFLDGTLPQATCSQRGEIPTTDTATNPDGTPVKKPNLLQRIFGSGGGKQAQPPPQQ